MGSSFVVVGSCLICTFSVFFFTDILLVRWLLGVWEFWGLEVRVHGVQKKADTVSLDSRYPGI